jgi:hypothetical protein
MNNEWPNDSVAELEKLHLSLLHTIRTTLDPKDVAKLIRKLSAAYGAALVDAVAEAVALRLDKERLSLEAARVKLWPERGSISRGGAPGAARTKGYFDGQACSECRNVTLVRAGACFFCLTCGATTGCS